MRQLITYFTSLASLICLLGGGMTVGCAGRPSLFPSSDPNLRRNEAQFAADAAKRHPYESDLPRGGDAEARASIEYTFKSIQILNYSSDDWQNIEIWVNQKYVVFLPSLPHGKDGSKVIEFAMLFDDSGNFFQTDGGKVRIETLEMLKDGKIYTVKTQPAD